MKRDYCDFCGKSPCACGDVETSTAPVDSRSAGPASRIEILERLVADEIDPCLLDAEGRKVWLECHKKQYPSN